MMRIAVCGAGAMGSGIAQVAAQAGHPVHVFDVQPQALAAGKARIEGTISGLVQKGKLDEADGRAIIGRLEWTSDLEALGETDLAIEAIIEDAVIKGELFGRLEAVVRDDAVIASNTSSIPIARLARGLAHPERFIGMHFFNPAPVMKLVEVVAGPATDPAIVERVTAVAQGWGKIAIPVADVPGFIVNRVARPFYAEAFTALNEAAADAATIDALFRSAGFRMGPLELTDLIGQDVNFAVARSVYDSYFGQTRFVPQLRQAALVDAGWLGRKTGRGVFRYDGAAPKQEEARPRPAPTDRDRASAEAAMSQMVRGDSDLVDLDGVTIGLTRGRTARQEARECGRPVALLDWFDPQGSGAIGFAASNDQATSVAESLISGLGRLGVRTADRPGLIVMRTLAQIANGAADAVLEQVADEAGIDAALRFGANYPFGPFAWMDGFGRRRLVSVLDGIASATGTGMYRPSPYLRDSA
jgi:3-hydroxybutyryl-CoA dehydrogenase